jgi:putative SOS response-associated peptidase YedK
MIERATCRYSRGSSLIKWLRSFGTEPAASASLLWRVGACRGRRSLAVAPITNIHNVASPHWRGWLGKQNRCIVPATSFCEYAGTKLRKTPKWFALNEDRPLFAFAGLWTPWRGVRGPKSAPVDGQHELFGFLTTEPNAVVAPIHPKAMPVILTTPDEIDLWLLVDTPEALESQRHCPTMRCESSRVAKRRMARARVPCSTGIETQGSRFDALRGFQPYDDSVCMTATRKYRLFADSVSRDSDRDANQLTPNVA